MSTQKVTADQFIKLQGYIFVLHLNFCKPLFARIMVAAHSYGQSASIAARPSPLTTRFSAIGHDTESYPYIEKLADTRSARMSSETSPFFTAR